MDRANGGSSQKKALSDIPISGRLGRLEAAALLAVGASAIVLHTVWRLPLKLPGHQGVVWMTMLMAARSSSRYRWAGVIVGAGATTTAAFLPGLAAHEPLAPATFLPAAIAVDLMFYSAVPRWRRRFWFLGLVGAMGHATKPLLRAVLSGAGWAYAPLILGLAYPLIMHLLFGFIGGVLGGVLATKGWMPPLKPSVGGR